MELPKLKPLAKGALSFLIPGLRTVHGYDNPLGTRAADSCYSIFLRHLVLLHEAGIRGMPEVVAELGPGSSIGVGLAALIAGATEYYALDLTDFTDPDSNVMIFDELVSLFSQRTPIPSVGVHSCRFPDLSNYSFPDFLPLERESAFTARMQTIRRDIAERRGGIVHVAAPWTERAALKPHSVDWVISQSVMEHIDDIDGAYTALAQWLKPGGCASHLIDFSSHNMTWEWNGHWSLNEMWWSVLRGRRPYLLNRLHYTDHARLAETCGFRAILEKRSKRFDGRIPDQFAGRFRDMSDEDARAAMVFVIWQLNYGGW